MSETIGMKRNVLCFILACMSGSPIRAPALTDAEAVVDLQPLTLSRYHWRISDARSAGGRPLETYLAGFNGRTLTLDFFGDSGLSADSGCNTLSEHYNLKDGRLLQSSEHLVTRTLSGCTPPVDDAILEFLNEGPGIRADGTLVTPRLHLLNERGDRLEFIGALKARERYGSEGDVVHVEIDRHSDACKPPAKPLSCMSVRELPYALGESAHGVPGAWAVIEDGIEGFDELPASATDVLVRRFRLQHPRPGQSEFVYVRLDL